MQNKEKLRKIAKKRWGNTKNMILLCRVTILYLTPCSDGFHQFLISLENCENIHQMREVLL